jgi:hypothetical protein
MERKLGALGSSIDGSKLGKTVEGLIIGLSVVIIWAGQSWLGVSIGGDAVTAFAIDAGTAVSVIVTLFGIIRKIVVKVSGN